MSLPSTITSPWPALNCWDRHNVTSARRRRRDLPDRFEDVLKTIDGGEWLKNGQEFAHFVNFPREQVKAQMKAMKPKKK